MTRDEAARAICEAGVYLASRGLTPGTSGNISLRIDRGFLMTPTNASLAALAPADLAVLDPGGERNGGRQETKERDLHLAVYRVRPQAEAIVHVHSTYAVALACLRHPDPSDVLIPLTPYAVMRIGRLPLTRYAKPGSADLARAVGERAGDAHAILLANHGPIVAAPTLAAAIAITEEIEEAAKLQLLLHGREVSRLEPAEVELLRA
ncbi:MAG TPA: class II aldolase/adducin family protein [Candidatus Acidoferrum sp.]|jgi:ribulose-5-phosphate 4-epimerase/fuculose-1-phosphate aldolase|nr:class II aldolase/adducin family protein [Candidatus Acidoferrum sp.]